jgi:hypothetical protein
VCSDDLPPLAELLNCTPHGNPGYPVLLGQLGFTGEPRVWRKSSSIYVGFDVSGHLDGHSHGRAMVDAGRSVIQ